MLSGVPLAADALDDTLRNSLQDRAARDTIRRIHLAADTSEFLGSVFSSLTTNCEGIRSSSVESIIVWDENFIGPSVDVSDFFAHYRLPKLRHLELIGCKISSWDLLSSQTSALETLELHDPPASPPTASQLLSILTSNPALRKLRFSGRTIPIDNGDRPSSRVPLHHLKELGLSGDLRNITGLLHRLDHPKDVDLHLNLPGCTVGDISQILRPYLRDRLQHSGRSRNGLGLSASWSSREIGFSMGDGGTVNLPTPEPKLVGSFMTVFIDHPNQPPPRNLLEGAILDLITDTPREEDVYLQTDCNSMSMEDLHT